MKHISVKRITTAHLPYLMGTAVEADAIRQLRKPLLAAFDIYKGNVLYGVITETEAEREAVLAWYQALLAREVWPLSQIPAGVLPYVGGAL